MSLRGEELIIDGRKVSPRIDGSLTAASLTRAMDSASSLSLTIADPDLSFLLSGALTRAGNPSSRQEQFDQAAWSRFAAGRLNLDGISFRLAGSQGQYDVAPFSNILTLEDEMATIMRLRSEAVKVSRGDQTRAEFNRLLVQKALSREQVPFTRAIDDRYFSPQAGQRQKVKEPSEADRQKGIHHLSGLTVKGAKMTSEQRRNAETLLTVADAVKAGERATLALIDAAITESRLINVAGGTGSSSGILQVTSGTANGVTPRTVVDPRTGQVHGGVQHRDDAGIIAPGKLNPRNIKDCARVFLIGSAQNSFTGVSAVKYASDHPDAEIYEIAQAVQGSGAGAASNGRSNYGPWVNEAKAILDAWGGVGQLHTIRESFEFRAGGKRNGSTQNYWDDSGNNAQDVNWRRFADRNRVWFVNDAWLFGRKPIFVIDGAAGARGLAAQGIIGAPSYQLDIGLPVGEVTVNAFLARWGGPPGGVVQFLNMGALTGRWLIWSNTMDLMAPQETAQLVLRRPAPQKAEPTGTTRTVQTTETRPDKGSTRDMIVSAAQKARKLGPSVYRYLKSRPMPSALYPPANIAGPGLVQLDCSAFVTLVYKTASAPDPNGRGYDGSGNTDTLIANGKKTSDPQPGDLVFYRSPAHVGVYIGNGKVIEMGGNPGPNEEPVSYRSDLIGYYTYDLGTGQ